ncbi:hypothetical protein BpHYR1_041300 [Brachionus plicatilis]|uniref:Uncharacterized protein n=1 Tax=Brachionus plicatilis TaxID=10195 RepID=A0A3M7R514_BRAPC|nr:hypothetical protein BpHYR1_041300 [Brachionus plicatilis]
MSINEFYTVKYNQLKFMPFYLINKHSLILFSSINMRPKAWEYLFLFVISVSFVYNILEYLNHFIILSILIFNDILILYSNTCLSMTDKTNKFVDHGVFCLKELNRLLDN